MKSINENRTIQKRNIKNRSLLMVLLLLVPVIWGGGFLVTASTLASGLSTPEILVSRFFIAAVVLLIFRGILGLKKSSLKDKFTKKDFLCGIIAGAVNFLGFYFQTLGLEKTDSARSAMITGGYVVLVPILYCILYKKFRIKTMVNALIFFTGLVILTGVDAEKAFNWGDGLTIISAIFFAVQIIIVDGIKDVNPVNFTIFQMLTMSIMGLIPMAFSGKIPFSGISLQSAILSFFYLGVLSSGYAYIVQTFAQRKISPNLTSIILSLESLASVVLSLIFNHVSWSETLGIGCLIMLLATIFASIDENKASFEQDEKENIDTKDK